MPSFVSLDEVFAEKVPQWLKAAAKMVRVPYLFCSPSQPHIEGHPMHVVAVGYLTDAPQNGGALLVWPGSHCDLYAEFHSTTEHLPGARCAALMEAIGRRRPVQLSGKAGDVILFHHRLMHAASVHRRRIRPRHAVFVDFSRGNADELSKEPPTANVWEHWGGLKPLADDPRTRGSALTGLKPSFWRRKEFDGLFNALRSASGGKHKVPQGIHHVGARERRPGDIWVLLSDDEETFASNALQVSSKRKWEEDLSVRVDGHGVGRKAGRVTPFNIKPHLDAGRHVLNIKNTGSPVFLRVVELSLPFHESKVIFRDRVVESATVDVAALRAGYRRTVP
jgi:hypothetical protein